MNFRCVVSYLFSSSLLAMLPQALAAFVITDDLEALVVPSVGTSFQSISFENSYSNPVVVCNGEVPSNANWTPVVRLNNVTANGAQVRVQKFSNVANDTSNPQVHVGNVHCIVSEAGTHQLPDGSWYQAGTVNVTGTNRSGNWNTNQQVQVTGVSSNLTGTLGVLAQVMTHNDSRGQVPFLTDCESRGNHPFQSGFNDGVCVGRHTAGLNATRSAETMGYIILQSGAFEFARDDGLQPHAPDCGL